MSYQDEIEIHQNQFEGFQQKLKDKSLSPQGQPVITQTRRIQSGTTSMKGISQRTVQKKLFRNPKDGQSRIGNSKTTTSAVQFPSLRISQLRSAQDDSSRVKKSDDFHLQQLETIDYVQKVLGPQHHCHFEQQVKQLMQRIQQNEELAQRSRDELDRVIWMVKNYNSEGLISRLLHLQKLKNDLEIDREQMKSDIEMLGIQRDDWHIKYQEIHDELLKMQGMQKELSDVEHKLAMQTESLEKMNKRLRDRQLEVQDWQRKCNTHDEQFKKTIAKLEITLKEEEQVIGQLERRCQMQDQENLLLQTELRSRTEKLDDEQRRSKQLHAELLDIRVNRVQQLQDEIAKQKKVIQSRVEEIEEQEKKSKTLQAKITLLETQLRSFDDVAKQEKDEIEKGWAKKYKELEKLNVQNKRELNQLEIQMQQNDLLTQQKESEIENALLKLQDVNYELETHKSTMKEMELKLSQHLQEMEDRDQQLEQQENELDELKKQIMVLNNLINNLQEEALKYQQQISNLKKQIEQLQDAQFETEKQTSRLKDQILQAQKESSHEKVQLEAEMEKNRALHQCLRKQEESFKKLQASNEQEQANLHLTIESKDQEIVKLKLQISKYEDHDQDLATKFKELEAKLHKQIEVYNQLNTNYEELATKCTAQSSENDQLTEQLNSKTAEIEYLQQHVQDVKNDKSEQQQLNSELELLKAKIEEQALMLNDKEQDNQKINQLEEAYAKVSEQLREQNINSQKQQTQCQQLQNQLEEQKKQSDINLEQQNIKYQNQIDLQNQQAQTQQKKMQILNDELDQALDKIEMLEEALLNANGKDIKLNLKQVQPQLRKTNTFQQIFIEEKQFVKGKDEEVTIEFKNINFNKAQAHLTIFFWIKVDQVKSVDLLPIMRITTHGNKLLEMGVLLESRQVYTTYLPNNHPQNKKKQNPITVTSQLSIAFGKFQLVAMSMTESGLYMDIGLCLNGVRDDQVSIASSLLFPEASLNFGKYSHHEYLIKDSILLTENITQFNIFKEVFNTFNSKYNPGALKPNATRKELNYLAYPSAGDFIHYLLSQQDKGTQNSKSKSPRQALYINDRMVPAGLLNSYDLMDTDNKQGDTKQDVEIEVEPVPWTRKAATERLKKYLFKNFNYKALLKPIIDNYEYISMGLQYLQPQRLDETSIPTKFHTIIKPGILLFPYYAMKFKQFTNYLEYVGVLRISIEELVEVCKSMEVIYTIGKVDYIHYDHFLIILRECIMHRADLKKQKLVERPPEQEEIYDTTNIFTEYVAKSTGVEQAQSIHQPTDNYITRIITILQDNGEFCLQFHYSSGNRTEQPMENVSYESSINLELVNELVVVFTSEGNLCQISTENQKLTLAQPTETLMTHTIQINQLKIVKFEITSTKLTIITLKEEKVLLRYQVHEEDPDEQLEVMSLIAPQDNWNLGKFYININRCRNCEKHQQTTRHQEADFIQKTEYISGLLKEIFPNVEIVENEDKLGKLEAFEVYIKNAVSKAKMVLLQKQENMASFMQNFDKKLPDMYEKLMLVINFQKSTEQVGIVQESQK